MTGAPSPDPARWHPLDLYERLLQSPAETAAFLAALHGGSPRHLLEDFAGTAAVSRAWVAGGQGRTATATDFDAATLYHHARAAPSGGVTAGDGPCADGVARRVRDLLALAGPGEGAPPAQPADVLYVGNFSLGYAQRRETLDAYLRSARTRLTGGGLFVADTYGGRDAFTPGGFERAADLTPDGRLRAVCAWERRSGNPLTGMVENAAHFRVFDGREAVADFPGAFVYRWRLWSLTELHGALCAAGFGSVAAYATLPRRGETPSPVATESDGASRLGENWAVAVVARAAG